MGGHDHCAVYGCNHRRDKHDNLCGFYGFPKQTSAKSLWIHASGRQDLNLKNVSKYTKICGCHFVSGKPVRKNKDSVDYIPTLVLPNERNKDQTKRQSQTSEKSRQWSTALACAQKETTATEALSKRTRRKLTFSEVPSVGQEIEISSLSHVRPL